MAEQVVGSTFTDSFEYELFEGDPDHLKTVVSGSNKFNPWIDPGMLKLTHRIARGPFGDVWIATHHQSTADYDEYHEVAVKMLFPIKEDQIGIFLSNFEDVFSKCGELQGVCFLHGVTIISGKICIVMKFYDGSVGDKMTRINGGKLSLPDVLRYGIDLAQGIMELHSRGILVLNLKPFNFLLNELDQAIIGDFGIPSLLLGISLPSSDMVLRLGTPNYMAPEQWQPDIRGPISFETDSWAFGCSIVEMFTGIHPWFGKSPEEIYHLVVTNKEKPNVPSGLPTAVENVINGCFEYDLRNRPVMADILHAFESCQNTLHGEEHRICIGNNKTLEKSTNGGSSEWFLFKDVLQVGDCVRSRKPPNSYCQETMCIPEGTIVGLDSEGFVLVRVHGIHDPLRVSSSTLERVTSGFAVGAWVRVKEEGKKHSHMGILHSITREGRVTVGCIGLETLWRGNCSELQLVESFSVGQFVRIKTNVPSPRFEWPRKRGGEWAVGKIYQVLPNGCLVVKFPGRLVFGDYRSSFADPAETEVVSFRTCDGITQKYQHLEDFHWSVRPLVIALGLFTALKLGLVIGKKSGRTRLRPRPNPRRRKGGIYLMQGENHGVEGENTSNSGWLPPPVANIFFRESSNTPA